MNWRLRATCVFGLIFGGCGTDLMLPIESPLARVVKATSAEIASQRVIAGSYIVMFRGQSISHYQLNMANYKNEWAFHNSYLVASYAYDTRVKKVSLYSLS